MRSLVLLGVVGLMAGIAGAYGAAKFDDWKASYDRAATVIHMQILFEKAYRDVLSPDLRWTTGSR